MLSMTERAITSPHVNVWTRTRRFDAFTMLNPTIEIMGYEKGKIRLRGLNNL
ncbi:hypothetical protein HRbin16_01903 [bacterium HR16]|nr:hypothetical protein HRbin16_01903 [bacterium HR16]